MVKQIHEKARQNLEEKTKLYEKQANKGKREMIFEVGDQVWVHLRKERFPAERKSKLMPRTDGPFTITRRINDNAYQVDLQGKYNVSPSFNVADLSPFIADEADLRTNPFQEGGDDMIMPTAPELTPMRAPELEPEDALAMSSGPMTRARTRELKETIHSLLSHLENSRGERDAYQTILVLIQAS